MCRIDTPQDADFDKDGHLRRPYHCGDRDALAELLQIHGKSLHGQARRQSGGNPEIFEEALAKLNLRLTKKHAQYDATQPWRPWAGRILRHKISDLFRCAGQSYRLTKTKFETLADDGVPAAILHKLRSLEGKQFYGEARFHVAVAERLSAREVETWFKKILAHAASRELPPVTADRDLETPPSLAESKELEGRLRVDIRCWLRGLTEKEQAIFVLKFYTELTFAHIADVLYGVRNPNLVAPTYIRLRFQLEVYLKQRYPEDP